MARTTRDLLELPNSGHAGINALFSKAHSMDWDIDRDVDWSLEIAGDDPCVAFEWAPFGRTPTWQALPREVKVSVTRAALARMLNVLQVGESVAQDVCARLALLCRTEDYRNHAVAQAMDEARHHLAYVRFLRKMGDTPEPLDAFTTAMFDQLLASEDELYLVAGEQFFLESLAMPLFERMAAHATHPLLEGIVTRINRDESRHVAFGVLYVAEHLRRAKQDERVAFAQRWLPQIAAILGDGGPAFPRLTAGRLQRAGVADPEGVAGRMRDEQRELDRLDRAEVTSGRRVPHLLTSARRSGLLAPDLLAATGLSGHPLVEAALLGSVDAA